jgi:hypothetical protein
VLGLALLGGVGWLLKRLTRRRAGPFGPARAETVYLAAWLLLGAGWLSVISYSPSRYYVSVYPALVAVAAFAACRPAAWWRPLTAACPIARTGAAAVAGLLVYHVAQVLANRAGAQPSLSQALIAVSAAGAAATVWLAPRRTGGAATTPRWLVPCAVALWLGVNGFWLGDWARSLAYTQYETSRRLGSMLPASAVLIGDVAPGLCLDNGLVAANVIPGLCNYRDPIGQFAGRPRYIAILDGRWKEQFWLRWYPEAVAPSRRIYTAMAVRWRIGVYAVPESNARRSVPSPRT